MTDPLRPPADDKDWTWVLERTCPACGFDPTEVHAAELPARLRAAADAWLPVLDRADVATRPAPHVWSPLEYAAHVRDVYELFGWRVRLMLDQDDPQFPNWDQDATALDKRYWEDDPAQVAADLDRHAADAAEVFRSVDGDQWSRTGRRSNGSEFTVESLGRYFLHDVMHHLHDVDVPIGVSQQQ